MTRFRIRPVPELSCTAVHDGRRRPLLAMALAGLAIVALASLAIAASPVPTPRLMASGSVRAGQVVEIRWDPLPPGVPEMELLLSVDGGRHYPIRLTAEMSGLETSYRWKVPNLTVREARIRLRANLETIETESEPGREFSIVGDPDQPAELEQVAEGDWWEGLDEIDGDAAGLRSGEPAFHASSFAHFAEAPQRDRPLLTPAVPEDPAPDWSAARGETAPAHVGSTAPLSPAPEGVASSRSFDRSDSHFDSTKGSRMSRLIRAACAALMAVFVFCLLAPRVGFAQDAPADTAVVPIQGVVVTGTRVPERVLKIPGGVTLVPKGDFGATRNISLKDALGFVPGVFMQSRSGAQDVRITIRGFGARGNGDRSNAGKTRGIRVLTDGVPITEPDGRTSLDFADLGCDGARSGRCAATGRRCTATRPAASIELRYASYPSTDAYTTSAQRGRFVRLSPRAGLRSASPGEATRNGARCPNSHVRWLARAQPSTQRCSQERLHVPLGDADPPRDACSTASAT